MKKALFVGRSGSGKTTLSQVLNARPVEYTKTQAVEYSYNLYSLIDTPGEYLENRNYYKALIVTSYDADVIFFVHSSVDSENSFPPGFSALFAKEVYGIVTKIDVDGCDPARSEYVLRQAGVDKIFKVSALCGIGIDELAGSLNER